MNEWLKQLRNGDWARLCWQVGGKVRQSPLVGEVTDYENGGGFIQLGPMGKAIFCADLVDRVEEKDGEKLIVLSEGKGFLTCLSPVCGQFHVSLAGWAELIETSTSKLAWGEIDLNSGNVVEVQFTPLPKVTATLSGDVEWVGGKPHPTLNDALVSAGADPALVTIRGKEGSGWTYYVDPAPGLYEGFDWSYEPITINALAIPGPNSCSIVIDFPKIDRGSEITKKSSAALDEVIEKMLTRNRRNHEE